LSQRLHSTVPTIQRVPQHCSCRFQ
jgi:hypothetical protein